MRAVLTVLLWLTAALLLWVTPGCSVLKPYVNSDEGVYGVRVIKSDARGNTVVVQPPPTP